MDDLWICFKCRLRVETEAQLTLRQQIREKDVRACSQALNDSSAVGLVERMASPRRGSTLMTSAPKSARIAPALGAATQLPASMTLTFSRGEVTSKPF